MTDRPKPWLCDPRKNTKCRKGSCFIFGGECFCTYDQDYAYLKDGKPVVAEEEFINLVMECYDEILDEVFTKHIENVLKGGDAECQE